MSGDGRMFARERVYRFTVYKYIHHQGGCNYITCVTWCQKGQYLHNMFAGMIVFPLYLSSRGFDWPRGTTRTPRDAISSISMAPWSWESGWFLFGGLKIRKHKDDSVAMLLHFLCVFMAGGPNFPCNLTTWRMVLFFSWKIILSLIFLQPCKLSMGRVFWLKDSSPEAKAAKSEKKKADKEGVLKGWAWELKMAQASPAWRLVWYMDNFDVKRKEKK